MATDSSTCGIDTEVQRCVACNRKHFMYGSAVSYEMNWNWNWNWNMFLFQ